MGLLSWLRGRRRDNTDPTAEEMLPEEELDMSGDVEEESEREPADSSYAAPTAQAKILAGIRRDAEADAVRHAEDMLDRQFPITAKAEATAASRLAALRGEFVVRDTELRKAAAAREREIRSLTSRQAAIQSTLREFGIADDQMDMEPLRAPRLDSWRIVAGLAIGAALSYLVIAADVDTVWLAVGILAALALLAALFSARPEDIEDREVAALRRSNVEVGEQLAESDTQLERIGIGRKALRRETRTLAEGEVAFAGQMAAEYEDGAFSAMPAGSLEGGREFAAQRLPEVELPVWVDELETLT